MYNFLQYIARNETLPCLAVHFFRLRHAAIRYALGANLGKDQTVMLDWWDGEKMTLEKLAQLMISEGYILRLFSEFLHSH